MNSPHIFRTRPQKERQVVVVANVEKMVEYSIAGDPHTDMFPPFCVRSHPLALWHVWMKKNPKRFSSRFDITCYSCWLFTALHHLLHMLCSVPTTGDDQGPNEKGLLYSAMSTFLKTSHLCACFIEMKGSWEETASREGINVWIKTFFTN